MDTSKRLRFSEPLPELILSGKKTVTWRIGDEKNIRQGDILSLCDTSGKEFAQADVVAIKETWFGKLTPEDKNGHEPFASEKEMYDTYAGYYQQTVEPETVVKVIRFRLR